MIEKTYKTIILCTLFILSTSSAVAADESIDLSAYKGKVVLVDFWASWCVPCRKSFPWLNKVQSEKKSKGLVVITINVDENKQDADAFLNKYPAHFPVLFDPTGRIAEHYKIIGMPSSLIFDRQGKLVEQHVGFKESHIKEYEALLDKLLIKKP